MPRTKLNKHELFHFITQKLIKQGKRSIRNFHSPGDPESCAYRATDSDGRTLKCAAGWIIPDRLYTLQFEGRVFRSIWDSASNPDVIYDGDVDEARRRSAALVKFLYEKINLVDQPEIRRMISLLQNSHDDISDAQLSAHKQSFVDYLRQRVNILKEELDIVDLDREITDEDTIENIQPWMDNA